LHGIGKERETSRFSAAREIAVHLLHIHVANRAQCKPDKRDRVAVLRHLEAEVTNSGAPVVIRRTSPLSAETEQILENEKPGAHSQKRDTCRHDSKLSLRFPRIHRQQPLSLRSFFPCRQALVLNKCRPARRLNIAEKQSRLGPARLQEERRQRIYAYGEERVKQLGIKPEYIERIIDEFREENRGNPQRGH
jgi:hypothetical protein